MESFLFQARPAGDQARLVVQDEGLRFSDRVGVAQAEAGSLVRRLGRLGEVPVDGHRVGIPNDQVEGAIAIAFRQHFVERVGQWIHLVKKGR